MGSTAEDRLEEKVRTAQKATALVWEEMRRI